MLGELLGDSTGKRIVRRVLSTNPLKVEVSWEDSGKMLGRKTNGFGTYASVMRSDGSLYGEGDGAMISQDGDVIAFKGSGVGKLKADGGVSYRGILYYQTASEKLARLNGAAGVFEYEIDKTGKTRAKIWEWK